LGKAVTIGNTPMTFPAQITTGLNDIISLTIDGVETVVATIPPGDYGDTDSISAALKTAINTASIVANDIDVTSINGRLQFISGIIGPTSKIDIHTNPLVTTSATILGIDTVTSYKPDGNAVGNKNGVTRGDFPIAFPLTIVAGSNDFLSLDIDGIETVAITIPANVYADVDALSAVIQNQINLSSGVAQDILVTGLGNRLQFKSGTIGEDSEIIIDSLASTSAIDLGLSSTTSEKGSKATKSKLIMDMDFLTEAFDNGDVRTISELIGYIDDDLQNVLKVRSDLGARYNRIELTKNRLMGDDVTFTKLMSENEDVDIAQVIMNLTSEENVYKASLSAGARIIQPTLLDFLR
jgi:flagellin-like hook-associated protein FlgL